MRKTPYKTWLLAGFLLLTPWVAHAAGLGKLTIVSALGQPLLAEVDLVSVQTGELATLTARLAPPEAFTKANIVYSPALVGVRMSIERRADGQAYIKIISTRPINEPFLDLLVELSWAQGRLVREYTALVDPAGYAPTVPAEPVAPAIPPVAITPPVTTESQPIAPAPQPPVAVATPVEAKPAVKALPVKPPVGAAVQTADRAYGPVKRGDTLFKIASAVKLQGVTLEQMLVSLYHANPDAFAGNMNLLKTGKILRVPDKQTTVATGHSAALKEVRVETANWNAYRQKLAEAAGETPAGPKAAASGKITTKVDDKAAGKAAPKEGLRLSKGEQAAGKARRGKGAQRSTPNRIRMLEEEAIAREKSLAEANNRIAQLEKTIKDMQRVIEIKAQAPVAKPAPQPPEPDLLEQLMDEPAYLGGGLLVLIGLGGYLYVRRRRAQAVDDEPADKKVEPTAKKVEVDVDKETAAASVGGVLALLSGYWYALRQRMQAGAGGAIREKTAPGLRTMTVAGAAAAPAALATPAGGGATDVDPLAEAEMYLNFGRDVQAEEVLIAALAKNPNLEEAQLKLLQVYTARKDKPAFEKIARTLYAQTRGEGGNWIKAAAMGYAFDPKNAMYEAGASAPVAATHVAAAIDPDLDFNFDLDAAPNASVARTEVKDAPVAATLPPISVPPGNREGAAVTLPPAAPEISRDIVFSLGGKPEASPVAAVNSVADEAGAPMIEPDFRLDMGGSDAAVTLAPEFKFDDINFDLSNGPAAAGAPAGGDAKDDHWHDVQTKFDLARAYQEMGEKDGARGILQEVTREGDAGQRAEAQKLLDSLG